MADSQHTAELNQLLGALARSLVQYVGECWPWTRVEAEDERRTIDEIVERQQRQIAALADLIMGRGTIAEFGTFPTEFTDLHYVALDYLLDQLIADERSLVAAIESAAGACSDDAEAADLLKQLLAEEQENAATLEKLATLRAAGSAV